MGKKTTFKKFESISVIKRDKIFEHLKSEIGENIIDDAMKNLNNKIESYGKKKKRKKLIEHSKFVATLSFRLIKEHFYYLSDTDIENIILGAILHDICKFEEDKKNKKNKKNKKHNELGSEYVKDTLEYNETISIIVLYHKNGNTKKSKKNGNAKKVKEKDLLLCKIVHDADKMSKIYKDKNWNKKGKMKKKSIKKVNKKLKLYESKKMFDDLVAESRFYRKK